MIVSQTETVAVLSGYFHFGNNHDLISFLLELFGISELLTVYKMKKVGQLLQNLQQLRINRKFRFFYIMIHHEYAAATNRKIRRREASQCDSPTTPTVWL